MRLLQYNEAVILQRLKQLPVRFRVIFALLVVMRILPTYRRFHEKTGSGDPVVLEGTAERLWSDLAGAELSDEQLQGMANTILGLVPTEDDSWDEETQPYAEDAAAALAYAVRTRLNGSAQDASWAARRVYEAIDHYVTVTSGLSANSPDAEIKILSDARVQAELSRQTRDLEELAELSKRAAGNEYLLELRSRSEREATSFFDIA